MLPIVLIASNPSEIDSYLATQQKVNGIPNSAVFRIVPAKTELTIAQVRELRKYLTVTPRSKQIVALESFHTASSEVQNALLKTLEERNEHTLFILIASDASRILPTVLSRSTMVRLEHVNEESSHEKLLDEAMKGSDYSTLAQVTVTNRDDAVTFIDSAISYFRTKLSQEPRIAAGILKKLLTSRGLVLYNNTNPQLTIDNILIFIKRTCTMKV